MPRSAHTPTQRPATLEDFLAIPPYERCHEILDGELVRKTMPSANHGALQLGLGALLFDYDERSPRRRAGGWWLMTEVEVLLSGRQPVRPDLVGWRCERMPALPKKFPVLLRPDWVCEVVSPSDPRRDTIIKYRDYARAGIPYYWLLDQKQRTLTALKLTNEHYMVQAEARDGEILRQVDPFELVEIAMDRLFLGIAAAEEPE